MRDTECNSIADNLVAFGFKAENDPGHRFIFKLDDITINHRGFVWIIDDEVNGPAEYATLKSMIQHESFRWEE